MDYIAQSKDYWIAPSAISINLNALGDQNRVQASVASGAAIMCYLKNNAGDVLLGYNNAHQFQTWPLSLSPTYFNTDTVKYVYCAIPRTSDVGTMAVIVFPSTMLDVYGRAEDGTQVGSEDYYFVFLQGIISEVHEVEGVWKRTWTHLIDTGSKGTDEALNDPVESDWYLFSKVSQLVTFLKPLVMDPASWFHNLRLGNSQSNLTGVATADTPDAYIDADYLVATPSYINANALSKKHDDEAEGNIHFKKDITVDQNAAVGGDLNVGGSASIDGNLGVGGWIKALTGIFKSLQSENYTDDSMTGTGYQLTSDDGTGASQLVVDKIVARMKFIANILEARRLVCLGGNYVYSPAASVIEEVDYFDVVNGTAVLLGYTYIKRPWLLRRVPHFLSSVFDVFATKRLTRSTMSSADYARVKFFRCWLKADDGTTRTINTWRTGMLARCQTFDVEQMENATHTGTYSEAGETWTGKNVENKFYWRAVRNTGQGITKDNYNIDTKALDDGKKHNFVDLANCNDGEYTSVQLYYSGSDMPSAGDDIVCYGDWKNQETSNIITIDTVGSDAPAIKELVSVGYTDGTSIDWTLDNKMKTRISPVAGNRFVAPEFIIETTDGNVNLKVLLDSITQSISNIHTNLFPSSGHTDINGVVAETGFDEQEQVFTADLWSPLMILPAGTYCISWYRYASVKPKIRQIVATGAAPTCPDDISQSYESEINMSAISSDKYYPAGVSSNIPYRLYGYFTVPTSGNTPSYVYINVPYTNSRPVYRVQIEKVADNTVKPTPWELGTKLYNSQIKQTAAAIELTVTSKIPSINLVSLLSWTDGTTPLTNGDVKTGLVGSANAVYSPLIYLDAGTYTFSAYMDSGLFTLLTRTTESGSETSAAYTPVSTTETYQGKTRYKFTFVLIANAYVRVKAYIPASGTLSLYRPQIEVGSAMRPYEPSADAVGSTGYVNVKSNEVNLGVRTDLNDVGINITGSSKSISLYADKVKFYKNKAQATASDQAKVWIDGADGSIHAVDGHFDGTVRARNLFRTLAVTGCEWQGSGSNKNYGNTGILTKIQTMQYWIGFNTDTDVTVDGVTMSFDEGQIICVDDIPADIWADLLALYNANWRYCIGWADEVVITDTGGSPQYMTPCVFLPRAFECVGKIITIRNTNAYQVTLMQVDYPSHTQIGAFCNGVTIFNGQPTATTESINPTRGLNGNSNITLMAVAGQTIGSVQYSALWMVIDEEERYVPST